MKISLNWIADFVDVSGVSSEEFSDRITIHTAEVDDLIEVEVPVKNVFAAQVASVVPMDGGRTKVELRTEGGTFTSVCGAPNVREGMMTLAALPGATLAGGAMVETGEIGGVQSQAILCSARELNLWDDHSGIVELASTIAPGTPISELTETKDTLIEIDNKSLTHRPDLWGQYGFARELAGILRRELAPLPMTDLSQFEGLPAYPVAVDDPDLCPFLSAFRIRVPAGSMATLKMRHRLGRIGSVPRNLRVDATNYVQFELGQPTHSYAANEVTDLRVARSGAARDFVTLDGVTRKIVADDLLIFSGDTAVGLAGIMGGEESKVQSETDEIVLEAANFDGRHIRRTSSRLGIRTEASQRYEKKLPPVLAEMAPARMLTLLREANPDCAPVSRFSVAKTEQPARPRIQVPAGYLSQRAGTDIPEEESAALLGSIGFDVKIGDDGLDIGVPDFRSVHDIANKEDISEEVMRLFGYHNITPALPRLPIRSPDLNAHIRNQHRARRILSQSYGFAEVKSYGWHSKAWLSQLGYTLQKKPLVIVNPRGSDTSEMRETLVPNLLAMAEDNKMQATAFRLYEVGKAFWIDDAGEKREANRLAGVLVNQRKKASKEDSFFEARRALDDIARAAGLAPFTAKRAVLAPEDCPWGDASRVELWSGNACIGAMGVLSPKATKLCLTAGHAIWFEIAIDDIATRPHHMEQFVADNAFPGSRQDFTFVWPISDGYEKLREILDGFENGLLADWSLIDVFQPKDAGSANYTFQFLVQRSDRTITSEEIDAFRADLLSYLKTHKVEVPAT